MQGGKNQRFMKLLSVFAIIVVTAVVGHIVSIISYNSREHMTQGADLSRESYLLLDKRKDNTSAWLKRDFDLAGQKVDLSGQIFDGKLKNWAADDISAWSLTLRLHGDCFLNNAWCGAVEIHQGVAKGAEKVQTLDLRHCDRATIELDYQLEDNDLLIPLTEGDYLVYYPSSIDREVPVQAGGSLEMGLIFYYLGTLDLSDYEITYYYHKSYAEGVGFYLILTLTVLWCAAFFGLVVSSYAYRKAVAEMEHRKVGISYMAVIYDFICIVDLTNDDIIQIHGNGLFGQISSKKLQVADRLKELFMADIADEYQETVREFLDEQTLPQRLNGGSLACQYRSRSGLWYIVRLFAMEQEPGQPLERFIFAMRNIDEDWHEMLALRESRRNEEQALLGACEVPQRYSVKKLIAEAESDVRASAGGRELTMEADISQELPECLLGYPNRLRLALSCLALSDVFAGAGYLKLSLYCKEREGSCHLLFSLKNDAGTARAGVSALCLKVAEEIITQLPAELSVLGDEAGTEFYFELDQEICDQ